MVYSWQTNREGDDIMTIAARAEQTKNVLDYIRKSNQKNPVDATNKKLKHLLKFMGVAMTSTRVSGVAGGWVTSYEHDADVCNLNTARESLRNILNGIKSLGILHHNYIKHMNDKKAEITAVLGDCEAVSCLYQYDDITLIRNALKRLYRESRGNSTKKAVLDQIKPEHYAYYKLHGAYKSLSALSNKESTNSLREKHNDRVRVNPDYTIEKAAEILNDKEAGWKEKAVAIIVFTGRRPTEVLKTWKARKVKGETLLFDGQLKMRDRHLHEDVAPYYIPVLKHDSVRPRLVLDNLSSVQLAMQDEKITYLDIAGETVKSTVVSDKHDASDIAHNRGVTHQTNKKLNLELIKFYDSEGMTCRLIRAMYSEVAYKQHAPKGASKSAYTATILENASEGFSASRNYEQVELDSKIKAVSVPEKEDDINKDDDLFKTLVAVNDDVLSRKRAKALHVLHAKLVKMAEQGNLSFDDMTTSNLRKIPVNGKFVNAATIKDVYLDEILGMLSE